MNNNEINIGLWKTTSEKGTEYYRGVKNGVEINGKLYKATLFTNTKKKSDKSPDMTIKLTEIEQEKEQDNIQVPNNVKTDYKEKEVVVTDEDIDKTFNNEQLQLPF